MSDKVLYINNNKSKSTKIANVVSLGYNCEASQRIECALGRVDPYPFTWCAQEEKISLTTISDPNTIFDSRYELAWEGKGIHFIDSGSTFHLRECCYTDGIIDENKVTLQKNELFSRLHHMIGKWENLKNGLWGDTVFVLKLDESLDDATLVTFIQELVVLLNEQMCCNWELIIVSIRKLSVCNLGDNVHYYTIDKYILNGSPASLQEYVNNRISWLNIFQNHFLVSTDIYINSLMNELKSIFGVDYECILEQGDSLDLIAYYKELSEKNPSHLKTLSHVYQYNKYISLDDDEKIIELAKLNINHGVDNSNFVLEYLANKTDATDKFIELTKELFLKLKDSSEPSIHFFMGRILQQGVVAAKSIDQAINHYGRSVAQGYTRAVRYYLDALKERGTLEDYETMHSIAQTYSEKGNIDAIIRLFKYYKEGIGVEVNYDLATKYGVQALDLNQTWLRPQVIQALLKTNSKNNERLLAKYETESLINKDYLSLMYLADYYSKGVGRSSVNLEKTKKYYSIVISSGPENLRNTAQSELNKIS